MLYAAHKVQTVTWVVCSQAYMAGADGWQGNTMRHILCWQSKLSSTSVKDSLLCWQLRWVVNGAVQAVV